MFASRFTSAAASQTINLPPPPPTPRGDNGHETAEEDEMEDEILHINIYNSASAALRKAVDTFLGGLELC